jgi:hypothetical protein
MIEFYGIPDQAQNKGRVNTIKLSILKKFGAGTLVPFYGTEVPTP